MPPITICIELIPDLMTLKEKKSTSLQINNCVSVLKSSKVSINMILSNYNFMIPFLSSGYENWPVQVKLKEETIFTETNLIILSADADEDLEDLSTDFVYVIGGFVDKNRHKNYIKEKGKNHIVRKFNLNKYFKLTNKVLSINQCFGILVDYFETKNWKYAYKKNIPKRKIVDEY
ncbi:tRNA (guanine(9)-N1)-methyltransferase [Cucumispora dikerogammari]|nr:tRNA (guanine(9)-N1)-methyltransferase [Cucumispora dikerogammari]